MLTTIPFSGFYYTLHDQTFDAVHERMFSDDNGDCDEAAQALQMRVFDACDWKKAQTGYAEQYCDMLAHEFKIDMKFESMTSPREYNFETDRIFANIPEEEVKRLLAAVDTKVMTDLAIERFTSRSGFSSFYSANWRGWGDVSGWDHNQIGTLVMAYIQQEHGGEFDSYAEYGLMGDAEGNGWIDEWIEESTPGIERFYKIHEYLQKRKQRKLTKGT
jgi:hypothetical protein